MKRALSLAAFAFVLALLGCTSACVERTVDQQSHKLFLEFRSPTVDLFSNKVSLLRINLVTDTSMGSSSLLRLSNPIIKTNETYQYSYDFLIFKNRHRTVSIAPPEGEIQNFPLKIPPIPEPCGWTEWTEPSYIGSHSWDIMHDQDHAARSVVLPEPHYEMRYRVEKYYSPY